MALLEADVALPVVGTFVERSRAARRVSRCSRALTPGQELVRVVRDELARMMGDANAELNLRATPPAVILVAGCRGRARPPAWPSSPAGCRSAAQDR